MPEKLNRKSWAAAVKQNRSARQSGKSFTAQVKERKTTTAKSLSSQSWTKKVEQSRQQPGGGRHRALAKPSGLRKSRAVGGMLRSTIPRSRKEITETQRQALSKTGSQVPKRGINASKWAYDHCKTVAERRAKASVKRDTSGKKGINAEKWHFDHAKAKANKAPDKKGPTTHVSAEKRRTQRDAIAKHQPKQPSRPTQPRAKPRPKAPVQTRRR